jgi:hypothetical protein
MKKLLFYLLLFATPLLTQCDDDDHTPETLPEATQTGRGIFACLVDGKPFIDNSGSPNAISFNCFYQLVDGEYYFGIGGEDDAINNLNSIFIGSQDILLIENQTYHLKEWIQGNAYGSGGFSLNVNTIDEWNTDSNNYKGELKITKFDIQNQIISGTFWMDLKNPFTDVTIKIREGRFDTRFGL